MPSDQSLPTAGPLQPLPGPWKKHPAALWNQVWERYVEVDENDRARLESEAGLLGLDTPLGWISAPLDHAGPEKCLQVFQAKNPDLNLNRLPKLEPYLVAVGVLKMFVEE